MLYEARNTHPISTIVMTYEPNFVNNLVYKVAGKSYQCHQQPYLWYNYQTPLSASRNTVKKSDELSNYEGFKSNSKVITLLHKN